MIKHLLFPAFCMLMNMAVQAQQIQLVKNINSAPGYSLYSIEDHEMVNGKIFFLSYDRAYGDELFVTDGTGEGTTRLTDNDGGEERPYGLTSANGYAFYKSWQYDNNYLFRSDGTKEGTFPLKGLWTSFHDQTAMLEVNGTLYFSGYDGRDRIQLWKTDGTIAGTKLVKDLGERGNNHIRNFRNFKGKLHFMMRSGLNEGDTTTIWSSDGTETGTIAGAMHINGANSDFYLNPVPSENYMYFLDSDVLYKTDGTSVTEVTSGLKDLNNFITIGAKVYFTTGEEEEPQQMLSVINPDGTAITTLTSGLTDIYSPIAIDTTIYFTANDAVHGRELWKTDGTTSGTVLVKDIYPGNESSYPYGLTNVSGTLYFATRSAVGTEIWKSDGTEAGTVLVTNLNTNQYISGISNLTAVGNNLVFTEGSYDGKLWKTDGTPEGTILLTDFSSYNPVALGSNVIFTGSPDIGSGLYRTDLTVEGTRRITKVVSQGSYPANFTDADGTLYFSTHFINDSLDGLWKSDGTTTGTVQVMESGNRPDKVVAASSKVYYRMGDIVYRTDGTAGNAVQVSPVRSAYNHLESFTVIDNTVYCIVKTASARLELWKSEGTPVVARLVKAFATSSDLLFEPVVFKGRLYFGLYQGSYKIWKSDGTEAGTQTAPEFDSSGTIVYSSESTTFRVIGDYLYGLFQTNNGSKLIRTDGTSAGTTTVALLPFTAYSIFGAGGLIYITSSFSSDQMLLWRTDGTVRGTFQLAVLDLKLNYNEEVGRPADPFRLQTEVNGKMFFMNTNTAQGDQLWVSDGTVEGTHRVTQALQKRTYLSTEHTESLNGLLYFDYYEPETGGELWQSDGTPEGTHVAKDFTPGGNTGILDIKRISNFLMISAYTEESGYELYKFVPAAPQEPAFPRINAGGAAFTASDDRTFSADRYFTGTTQVSNAADGDIAATTDDQLYKEQRFGSSFSYNIPVTNGTYNVVLHFAEIYWGVPSKSGTSGPDKRQFHVDMEGARKLTDYDIFTIAGGAMRAQTETFTVNITDDTLNIDFLKGTADNPIIAAIEVLPTQVIVSPLADAFVRNTPNEQTHYGTENTLEVKAGSLPAYQRSTYLKFPLNTVSQVVSAKLRLYGSNVQTSANTSLAAYGVSDDSWTETGITWSNAPATSGAALGSVNVHSTVRYYEIDVTGFVRSELEGDQTVSLFVTNPAGQNNRLIFNSRENTVNRPQLVIETEASPAARTGSENEILSTANDPEASGIYPNPVTGRYFSVKVSGRHKGDVDLKLMHKTGQFVLIRKKPDGTASPVELYIEASNLSAGLYLLLIESKAHKEVLKLLVTK